MRIYGEIAVYAGIGATMYVLATIAGKLQK